jgi:hypothetical protein
VGVPSAVARSCHRRFRAGMRWISGSGHSRAMCQAGLELAPSPGAVAAAGQEPGKAAAGGEDFGGWGYVVLGRFVRGPSQRRWRRQTRVSVRAGPGRLGRLGLWWPARICGRAGGSGQGLLPGTFCGLTNSSTITSDQARRSIRCDHIGHCHQTRRFGRSAS